MNFPSSYDTEDWALAGELVVLTVVTGGISATDTSVTFNETAEVSNLNTPTYLTFETEDTAGNFEIVKVTGTATGGVCTISRGELSSTAMAHAAGAVAVQDPVSQHLDTIRTLLLGIEKYHGLVGAATALPATCEPGEVFMDTDNNAIYQAVATNTWREINELDHSTLNGLGDDDHTQYHTDSRKATWHTALTGVHITKAAHNHDGTADDGQPVARFISGLESAMPTGPSADGQVYYATDTNDLWIGNTGSWVLYAVMPTEAIIMMEDSCPPGYTEVTAFQNKIPRGAPTGVYSGFSDGGATTHDHEMQEVVNHTHTIASVTGNSLASTGNHEHSKEHEGSGGLTVLTYTASFSSTTILYTGHTAHSHSVTLPQHDTDDEGSNPADTDTASSWPPYVSLVFCEKD
jgi:hypothetical protein